MTGGLFQLLAYGAQDIFLSPREILRFEFVQLCDKINSGKLNEIEKFLNNNFYTKEEIKKAINNTCNVNVKIKNCRRKNKNCRKKIKKIKILLASYLNKPIMKNIMDIQRKRNIWKYVFNWLTKPITNDGLLGIDLRLGLKTLGDLEYAPLKNF